jgi:hypothetical protein
MKRTKIDKLFLQIFTSSVSQLVCTEKGRNVVIIGLFTSQQLSQKKDSFLLAFYSYNNEAKPLISYQPKASADM